MHKLGLYLVTDSEVLKDRDFVSSIEAALRGGVQTVQLREKECSGKAFFEKAILLRKLTREYGVTFIINDRVDIAIAVDADGVHVGQSDIPAYAVRQLVGPNKIVGVSAVSVEEAVQAERDGADYVGVGAMFPTSTKLDAKYVTFEELKVIMSTVQIPTVVIGGITVENVEQFKSYDINGVAVVTAILASEDIEGTAKEWRRLLDK